ncbi:MAG: nucleotidyltransferase family protein, partial [Clostridia bacterium]|nr:nucleotidyltransferase family protein [Clostridia bacterium]
MKQFPLIVRYLLALIKAALQQTEPPACPAGVLPADVYKLAASHGIAGLVWYAVRSQPDLPAETAAQFTKAHKIAVISEAVQGSEVTLLLQYLEQIGCRYMTLKGWNLRKLYPKADMRLSADVDILFDPAAGEQVRAWMERNGYAAAESDSTVAAYHKPPFVTVEMHRALVSTAHDAYYRYLQPVWERARRQDGTCRYRMTPEDEYIYLLIHLTKHLWEGGIGIRAFTDLYLYRGCFAGQMNEEYLAAELEKVGLYDFEQTVRRLLAAWFDGAPCDDTVYDLTKLIVGSGAYGTVGNVTVARSEQKRQSRFRYVLSRIFPGLSYMKRVYGWVGRMPFLLPAAW